MTSARHCRFFLETVTMNAETAKIYKAVMASGKWIAEDEI